MDIQVYMTERKRMRHEVRAYAEYLLKTVYKRSDPIRIGKFGKPELTQTGAPLYFNGADSGAWVVCAFANRPIGIDLEQVKTDRRILGVARRMFGDAEADALEKMPIRRRSRVFAEEWAKREAAMKWTGRGFNLPMSAIKIDGDVPSGPELPDGLVLFAIPGFDSQRYAAWICGQYKEKPRITLIRD